MFRYLIGLVIPVLAILYLYWWLIRGLMRATRVGLLRGRVLLHLLALGFLTIAVINIAQEIIGG
jgi:hypothetical protein